jgi:hypothetical protein
MKPYIYLIYDLIKNKPYYVGKHNGYNKRYITGGKILNRYISLYGIDNFFIRFDKRIIEYTTPNDLDSLEEYYIKKFKTKINGGNLTHGGKWDIQYRTPTKKPIIQYDLNGNFIKEWEYVRQPVDHGVLSDYNGVSACCLGHQKSAGGFIWRFKELSYETTITPPTRKKYKNNVTRNKYKPIEINGEVFDSITHAAKTLGWSFGKLNGRIKNNKINYKWIE